MKTSVYRTNDAGGKDLVAKFRLASDADFFAWKASEAESLMAAGPSRTFTVEDKNSVISRYTAERVDA